MSAYKRKLNYWWIYEISMLRSLHPQRLCQRWTRTSGVEGRKPRWSKLLKETRIQIGLLQTAVLIGNYLKSYDKPNMRAKIESALVSYPLFLSEKIKTFFHSRSRVDPRQDLDSLDQWWGLWEICGRIEEKKFPGSDENLNKLATKISPSNS